MNSMLVVYALHIQINFTLYNKVNAELCLKEAGISNLKESTGKKSITINDD